MTQHVSKWKLRFSEDPEGAEHSSLSRRELQLAPSVFQVWLPMLSFMSSFKLRSGDNVYTNIKICGSLYWSLILFSVVSTSWLISSFLSCTVIISQHHQPENSVRAAVCTSRCLLSDFSYVPITEEWNLFLHWAIKDMLCLCVSWSKVTESSSSSHGLKSCLI